MKRSLHKTSALLIQRYTHCFIVSVIKLSLAILSSNKEEVVLMTLRDSAFPHYATELVVSEEFRIRYIIRSFLKLVMYYG